MNQFLTFVQKEFYHVFRDKKSLLMLFGVPIAQILLFGFALTNEIKNSSIAIFDFSNDEISRQLVQKISESSYFEVTNLTISTNTPELDIEQVFKKQAASKSYNTFRQVLIKNYIKRNTNLCAMFPAQKAVT